VQQQQPAGDAADRCSTADSAQQQQEAAAAAFGSSSRGTHRRLCYSCNRQILQQVKPAAGAGVPKAAAVAAAGAAAGVAALSLEQKMQRLKQLLPPGMLLESDSEDDAVC
jgi:hypothetical protein